MKNHLTSYYMIILEGCDGTGKSTLAKRLKERFPFLEFHKDRFHLEGLKHYVDLLQLDLTSTVWDRFHLGEVVYPQIKEDGRKPLSAPEQYMLELRLLHYQPVVIYCETLTDQIVVNFETRGEDFVKPQDISRITVCYREAIHRSILPRIKYDYLKDNFDLLCAKLEAFIFVRQGQATCQACGVPICPDVMLVGDRTNPKLNNRHVAFLHEKGSSPYLMQAIANNGLTYYLTNAFRLETCTLQEEIRWVKPGKVIALGKQASQRLTSYGIEHSQAWHPQYAKRFHYHELEHYKQQLR